MLRLEYLGSKPLCNLKESRTYKINGLTLPLCARCLGLLVGFAITKGLSYLGLLSLLGVAPSLLLMLFLPIDWLHQWLTKKESTNTRRILSGICFSFGLWFLNN